MSLSLLAFFTGGWEWIIILLVLLLLFGASRIPKLARGLGEGVSEFKKGLNQDDVSGELEGEGDSESRSTEEQVKREKEQESPEG